ncbi:MAG: aminopeptidase P family protein [Rikenellaceae bacterium]|nr:aminopeptidase P family protein [Rikenellaceae bacterium]
MLSDEFLPELRVRRQALQRLLQREGVDGLWVSSNVNLYYLSGRVFSGHIYLPAEGELLFFVRRPVGLGGDGVHYVRKPEEAPALMTAAGVAMPRVLMLESDSVPYSEYMRYEKLFGRPEIRNGSAVLREARAVKTPREIAMIRRSGERHAEVYRTIPSLYRPGMTDLGLSIEIERQSRLHGSLGIFRIAGQSMEIFAGSVLAGDNADAPSPYDFAMGGGGLDRSIPVGADGTVLCEGMSVMVDVGGNFTGYMTDMTRVFSVGRLPDEAYRAHRVALDMQHEMAAMARPGTPAADIYNLCREMAVAAGLGEYFMGHRQQAGFVGHGVGIEINEAPVLAPRSRDVLAEGMVFAFEPKFVIPGTGAVGIENTFAVTDGGVEKLTICEEEIVSLG